MGSCRVYPILTTIHFGLRHEQFPLLAQLLKHLDSFLHLVLSKFPPRQESVLGHHVPVKGDIHASTEQSLMES